MLNLENLTLERVPSYLIHLGVQLESIKSLLDENVDTISQPEVLNVQMAAELLSLKKVTIYGLVQRREIPFYRRGKQLYFFRDQLIQWIKGENNADNYINKHKINKKKG